ncbi:MAG: pyridoxamine 5'-phosphate oxidase family protein [Xanthobacteraceae bacterium]|nr:MAG: pyridoxamine 5'-phosphate oxidase family protein [Xanthobacteraceae bacterium]
MAIITDDMIAIIGHAKLCFVATVNPDGTPNLSPKASLMAREDLLFFADISSPRTVANLRRNPAIAINAVDIFARRGYRFSGVASVIGVENPDYNLVAEWVWSINGRDYPVHDVVRVAVAEALPLYSPAYEFGTGITEEGLREAFLLKYGVKQV